ncbi:hypothetical protein H6P81_021325 [Aristolochia fimbriata]|uniref:Uncharacterized protein n=1 Tax=Aristolochia fimbriata TaxID=158543 RepID=A0AAV7DRR7_ARIFI|nr:hypothetical protein H6P81_021325 [Aristolochia fimbriata]
MHGSGIGRGGSRALRRSGARWTCAEWCFRQSRAAASSLLPFPFTARTSRGLVGSLAFPWCLCVFFPRRGSSPLMYSPFETRRRPVAAGTGGRNRRPRIFLPRLVSRRCARTPDARKCSWTHVNAAVPMDLVDSRTKSDRLQLLLDRRCPRPVLRRALASGAAVEAPRLSRGCYLVDPASSHMLVSKIKPCMCKYEQIQTVETANGSLNQL